jgi:hypothetical protein
MVMMLNATFNNISVISWQSVLLVEETGENHRPVASHLQTLSHNVGHIQKQVLSDRLMFLYMKLKAEIFRHISFATRLRPKYTSLTKYISRNKCLCQKHKNMALALKNMKIAGAKVTLNSDEFIRQLKDINPQEIISEIKDEKIK